MSEGTGTISVGRDVRRDDVVGYKTVGASGEVQVPPINTEVHENLMHQLGEHTELTIIDAIPPKDGSAPVNMTFDIDTSDRSRGPCVSEKGKDPRLTVKTETEGVPDMAIKVTKKKKEVAEVAEVVDPVADPNAIKAVILSNDEYDDIPLPGVSVYGCGYEAEQGRMKTYAIGASITYDDLEGIPGGRWNMRAVNAENDVVHEANIMITGCFKTDIQQFLVGQEVLD